MAEDIIGEGRGTDSPTIGRIQSPPPLVRAKTMTMMVGPKGGNDGRFDAMEAELLMRGYASPLKIKIDPAPVSMFQKHS